MTRQDRKTDRCIQVDQISIKAASAASVDRRKNGASAGPSGPIDRSIGRCRAGGLAAAFGVSRSPNPRRRASERERRTSLDRRGLWLGPLITTTHHHSPPLPTYTIHTGRRGSSSRGSRGKPRPTERPSERRRMAAAAAPSLSQESLVKHVGSSEMEFLVRGSVRECPQSPHKTRSVCVWLCLDKPSIHPFHDRPRRRSWRSRRASSTRPSASSAYVQHVWMHM